MLARVLVAGSLALAVLGSWRCGGEHGADRPAAAEGVLVYARGSAVWVAAADGSNARCLVAGATPRVSPDGRTVAFGRVAVPGGRFRTDVIELRAVAVAGGRSRRLLGRWERELAWSPDGGRLAAVARQAGRQRLVLVDVATGAARTIATGRFSGLSISPQGDRLVYGRNRGPRERSDLYVVATGGGAPRRLTRDGRGSHPLWGPDRIVFVHATPPPPRSRAVAPKHDLWLIDPDGGGRRRLTRDRSPFPVLPSAASSLVPTGWSANGARLLVTRHGETSRSAQALDPATGRMRAVGRGLVGFRLSGDGSTILAMDDFFGPDPGPRSDVVAVPFDGGRPRVLASRASDPDWDR